MSYTASRSPLHGGTARGEPTSPKAEWVERKVVCAKRLLRLCERIKERDEGRPILELVKDDNPARARGRG